MQDRKKEAKIEAILVTAVLCSVENRNGNLFRFCIPSGGTVDFDEMEALARENGVSEANWLKLLDKIEIAMDSLQ